MKIEGITYHGDKKDDDGRWINEDGLKILEFPQENIKIGIENRLQSCQDNLDSLKEQLTHLLTDEKKVMMKFLYLKRNKLI